MRKLMVAVCFALLAGGTVQAQNGSEAPRRGWNPEMVAKRMSERLMLGAGVINDEVTAILDEVAKSTLLLFKN